MWARRLVTSKPALRLTRSFGGHGGAPEKFQVKSIADEHYLEHYAPETIEREDWADANGVITDKADRHTFKPVMESLCNIWSSVRPYVLFDPLFARILDEKRFTSAKGANDENDEIAKYYRSLSPSQRYFSYLLDQYKRTESPSKFTTTNILRDLSPSWSNTLLRYLYKETDSVNAEREISEVFNPPKIHENSVFLYQSIARATYMKRVRAAELPGLVIAYLLFPFPIVTTVVLAATYYVNMNAMHFEVTRRFVSRMDLLPHLEMVAFQKVGLFGRPITKLVRIKDLERIEPDFSNENAFWGYNGDLDGDLQFRDKSTGELFVFDSNGYWNWEGISHKLLY